MRSFVVTFNYAENNILIRFRKKKKKNPEAQKQNIIQLPKLTSFFILEETNSQTNSSTLSSQDASNSQSSETESTF